MSIYLKIAEIKGNVSAKNYKDWIEVNSIHFSVNRHISTKPGHVSDRESTRPSVSEFCVSKAMDISSPSLFSEGCVGTTKDVVHIHICQTGENLRSYMEYTLHNVIVSGYSVEYFADDYENEMRYPSEKITLNFAKIETKFIPYDENHKPQSPIPAGYDLISGRKI